MTPTPHSLPGPIQSLKRTEVGRAADDPTVIAQQARSRRPAVVPARALTSHGARAVEINIEDHLTDAELFELAVCRWMDRRKSA